MGVFFEKFKLTSEDGGATIVVKASTIGLDSDSKPLKEILILLADEPPALPDGYFSIGGFYLLEPHGATFDPYASVIIRYDPSLLPEDLPLEEIVVASFDSDSDEWTIYNGTILERDSTITVRVDHFSCFTAAVPKEEEPSVLEPTPEPEPTPTQTPTETPSVIMPTATPPPPEPTAETDGFNWSLFSGIFSGVIVTMVMIYVLVRRYRY
jgi:hypothetical protein